MMYFRLGGMDAEHKIKLPIEVKWGSLEASHYIYSTYRVVGTVLKHTKKIIESTRGYQGVHSWKWVAAE